MQGISKLKQPISTQSSTRDAQNG